MHITSEGVSVTYKVIDGAHFFVPADKKALGLCVANIDLKVAYNEVGEQLSKIAAFTFGDNVTFEPEIPFEEFKKLITAYMAVTELVDDYDITANTTQTWTHSPIHNEDMEIA